MSSRSRPHALIPSILVVLVGVSALLILAAGLVAQVALNLGSVAALAVLRGDMERAADASRWLLWAGTSGNANAYWNLGLLAQRSRNEQLRRVYQGHVVELAPDRIALLARLAADDSILAQGAITLHPDSADALAWRGAQLEQSDPAAAVALYARALERDPKAYEWWLGLGRAYEAAGQFPEALAAYDRACTLAIGILPCREKQQLEQKMRGP